MEDEAVPLRKVVGENARRLREGAGIRQDDVSKAVKRLGLSWSRSKVAALERGDKAVGIEDLVVLADVLGSEETGRVHLADFFDGNGAVQLTEGWTIYRNALQRFLAGEEVRLVVRDSPEQRRRMSEDVQGFMERSNRLLELAGPAADMPSEEFEALIAEGVGEVEARAGKALGLEVWEVGALAARLWGRSMAKERDARAGEDDDVDARRARRGQVTRTLLRELRGALEEVGGHGQHQAEA